jgi:chromosomal replication initiation ATPase DnaA
MRWAVHPISRGGVVTLDPSDLTRARAISMRLPAKTHATMREWSEACAIPLDVLIGPSREAWVVEARQGLMWVLRHRLGLSYPEIGRAVRRDHSTVVDGVKAEERRRLAEMQSGSCEIAGLKDC